MADEEKSSMGDGEKPSMGDGEMSMADGEHSKDSVVPHFCQIKIIKQYVRDFTEEQRTLVTELGAGFVFDLGSNAELIHSLTKFCVHNVDCEKGALKIKQGVFLPIKDGIKDLYNMSDTGEKLKHPGRTGYKPPDLEEMSKFKYLSQFSILDLWWEVSLASGAKFCTLFMLALLNTVLAPSRNTRVDTIYLIDLMDHNKIKKLDWCSFIATFLINGIREYQICPTKLSLDVFTFCTQIRDADLKHAAKLVSRASLKNGKSADSVHSDSMDSSPHNFRSKNARKAVTQKPSARVCKAEIFLNGTEEILDALQEHCNLKTDVPHRVQSSRSVMSSGANDEDHQVTSSPVRVEEAPQPPKKGHGRRVQSSSGSNNEDRQVTSSLVRVEEEPQSLKKGRGCQRKHLPEAAQAGKVLGSTSTQVEPPAAQRAKPRGKNLPDVSLILSAQRKRGCPEFYGNPVISGQPGYPHYETTVKKNKIKPRSTGLRTEGS